MEIPCIEYYKIEDFAINMLIISKINDRMYCISKNEVYEIISLYTNEDDQLHISFLNDEGGHINKDVNLEGYEFDNYFRIA